MIYVLRKNENIYVTDNRNEISQENNTPVYIFGWELKPLLESIREWKILGLHGNWYSPDVLDYFESNKNNKEPEEIKNQPAYETWKNNISKEIDNALDKICSEFKLCENKVLVNYKTKQYIESEITYTCDIPNYLLEVYGRKLAGLILDYLDLDNTQKQVLSEFYKCTTKESQKLTLDKITGLQDILEFLPSWCHLYTKVYSEGKQKQNLIPQYKNDTKLDDPELEKQNLQETIKQDIYAEFNIGEIIRGSEIRTRLKDIYERHGISKTAKLVDLLDYFNITKARSEYEWFYRLVNRKQQL